MNPRIPNFVKIRPFGGELLNMDGQADMTKLMVGFFAIFANAPKNVSFTCVEQKAPDNS